MSTQPDIGSITTVDDVSPTPADMDRTDVLNAFLAVLNITQPNHPYYERDVVWPATKDDIKYGTTRSYFARCGPRRTQYRVYFATRLTWVNTVTIERLLAVLTHEVTHIPYCINHGDQHGGHPPEFWAEMAYHAQLVRDRIEDGTLDRVFGTNISVTDYNTEIVDDPNGSTVDRRYWSVENCKNWLSTALDVEDDRTLPPDTGLGDML